MMNIVTPCLDRQLLNKLNLCLPTADVNTDANTDALPYCPVYKSTPYFCLNPIRPQRPPLLHFCAYLLH